MELGLLEHGVLKMLKTAVGEGGKVIVVSCCQAQDQQQVKNEYETHLLELDVPLKFAQSGVLTKPTSPDSKAASDCPTLVEICIEHQVQVLFAMPGMPVDSIRYNPVFHHIQCLQIPTYHSFPYIAILWEEGLRKAMNNEDEENPIGWDVTFAMALHYHVNHRRGLQPVASLRPAMGRPAPRRPRIKMTGMPSLRKRRRSPPRPALDREATQQSNHEFNEEKCR